MALVALPGTVAAKPAPAGPIHNIGLVHGAFADGTGWRAVHDILVADLEGAIIPILIDA